MWIVWPWALGVAPAAGASHAQSASAEATAIVRPTILRWSIGFIASSIRRPAGPERADLSAIRRPRRGRVLPRGTGRATCSGRWPGRGRGHTRELDLHSPAPAAWAG